MSYIESKKTLDKIREEFSCKGEIIFRTAIQEVVSRGQITFLDDSIYKDMMNDIDANHNYAEANGKTLFISRDFEKAIVECARELSKIDSYDLLIYIQKEIWLGSDGINYKRAIDIAQTCLNYIIDNECIGNEEILDKLYELDLSDKEIEDLDFGWVFEEE